MVNIDEDWGHCQDNLEVDYKKELSCRYVDDVQWKL